MIQRDNLIAEQEVRIKSLEKGLARYLKSQVCSSGLIVIIEQLECVSLTFRRVLSSQPEVTRTQF
jgi:hypothetical protein